MLVFSLYLVSIPGSVVSPLIGGQDIQSDCGTKVTCLFVVRIDCGGRVSAGIAKKFIKSFDRYRECGSL